MQRMKARFADISAVILAGGRNSRMGRHKAFITVNSKRIIDSIMEVLRGLFGEIVIVTNEKPMFSEQIYIETFSLESLRHDARSPNKDRSNHRRA